MLHNDASKLRRNIDKTFFLFLCARSPLGCVVSLYQWLISAISGLKEVPEFLLRTFSKYLAFTPGKILFRVSMTSCDAAIFLSLKKITSVSIYYAMNERYYIFCIDDSSHDVLKSVFQWKIWLPFSYFRLFQGQKQTMHAKQLTFISIKDDIKTLWGAACCCCSCCWNLYWGFINWGPKIILVYFLRC